MTTPQPDIRARIVQCTAQPVPFDSAELGPVFIRRVTLGELDRMQKDNAEASKEGGSPALPMSVRLLARFLGDAQGKPIFDPEVKADLDVLLSMPVSAAAEILRKGNTVNNMEEGAEKK